MMIRAGHRYGFTAIMDNVSITSREFNRLKINKLIESRRNAAGQSTEEQATIDGEQYCYHMP